MFRATRLPIVLLLLPLSSFAQSAPVRYQAQYTQIYSDDVSTITPALTPGFVIGPGGSLTQTPGEVVDGSASIKGSYSGTGSYTAYLFTDAAKISFTPGHTYTVTFRYKVLTTPDKGFEALFYSPTAAAAGNFLPSTIVTGAAGAAGTATLTNTLGPYSDYQVRWDIVGSGAIAIDDIQIVDTSASRVVASETAEGTASNVGAGLQLLYGATVITDPALVVGGSASVAISNSQDIATNPAVVSIAGNTTYIVEFQYRIVSPGSSGNVLNLWMHPAGVPFNQSLVVHLPRLLKNAATVGTFSSGAQTAGASSWILHISANPDSTVIVDNIRIFRQDVSATAAAPAAWSQLNTRPFPRLGRYSFAAPNSLAQYPLDGIPPFTYTQAELEKRMAFADVIVGPEIDNQAQDPAFHRTLRQLNPNAVILPYRISEEQTTNWPAPSDSNVSPSYTFLQSVADPWYVRDSAGNYVVESDYPNIRLANISPFCPVVNGLTFTDALLNELNTSVFPAGVWDGVFFDNLLGRINPHIPNYDNPALLDYDWNRNRIRDETPASSSDMTRAAAIQMLRTLNAQTGGLQLVVGNAGPLPETHLAPHVNGYLLEGFNRAFSYSDSQPLLPELWRAWLDSYLVTQAAVQRPAIDVLEGGGGLATPISSGGQITPTATDLQHHRLAMTSALLGNGFYSFDLVGSLSTPYWYDEYSVNSAGTAVEDLSAKGYLGQPLTDPAQLANSGTLVFQENFDSGTLPATFYSSPVASVTQLPAEVISGSGSLVVANPDHTRRSDNSIGIAAGALALTAGLYHVTYDYRVLETLDGHMYTGVYDAVGTTLCGYTPPGIVAGDAGTVDIPFTVANAGTFSITFGFGQGGGKVAFDNIRVYQGGVGPWRRDFENGFVLVNPYSTPYTFSAAEIAGAIGRTNVRRIKGTQAPDVNNGQPVSGSLTVNPFDGIVLLADDIDAVPYQSGWWWNPAESGRGFFIEMNPNRRLFMTSFLYDATGRATWVLSTGAMSGSTYSGTLITAGGGQTLTGPYQRSAQTGTVGSISINFTDSTHATLSWPGGTIPIQRFGFTAAGASASPGVNQSGWWWNPAESGRGFAIEFQSGSAFITGFMYDDAGNPIWYVSTGAMTTPSLYQGVWQQAAGGQTLTGPYQKPVTANPNVGPLMIQFSDPSHALMTLPDGRNIPLTRFGF